MLKAISVWAFAPDRPLPDVFALARDAGFAGVELAIAEDGPLTPRSTQAECQAIAAQARGAGVAIVSLASGLGWQWPLTSSDPTVRRTALDYTRASLNVARWLGTDAILVVPGGVGAEFIPGFRGEPYDIAYRNLADALEQLKPDAEAAGVAIGLENVWNKFLLSPLEMSDVIDMVASPQIGCYYDVGNTILTGYPEQWITILGRERIKRVHFKDFQRSVGTLDGFCMLGDGDVNWPQVMQALRGIGYDGPVTAEYFHCESDLPRIAQAMEAILAL